MKALCRCPTCNGRMWAAWRMSRRPSWTLWTFPSATRSCSARACAAALASSYMGLQACCLPDPYRLLNSGSPSAARQLIKHLSGSMASLQTSCQASHFGEFADNPSLNLLCRYWKDSAGQSSGD